MVLHIITTAKIPAAALLQMPCSILLIDEGVYGGVSPKIKKIKIYAYKKDVAMRGLKLAKEIELIDDKQWLALTISHVKCITW